VKTDRSASVLARLLNRAKERGENYNLLLTRFAIERLLYRLSVSQHANSFVLKGALLFALWYDTPHRPTKDADLLGFGADDVDTLRDVFRTVCLIDAGDGTRFDIESMRIGPIRDDTVYGGLRLNVLAFIGTARLPLQVDIGFGDAITPDAEQITYPTLLDDMDAPKLRAYPVYTVIAEKFEAMVQLGITNSRMKDFFDLDVIAKSTSLDGAVLARAIRATFDRRSTPLPAVAPLALTHEFASDSAKAQQWGAFLSKAKLPARDLPDVVTILHALLWPAAKAAAAASRFDLQWEPDTLDWRSPP
jgi:Nucleotidyl transferase AbiEii toxin, Type IV TA system